MSSPVVPSSHYTICSLLVEQTDTDQIPRDQWQELCRLAISHGVGPALFVLLRRQDRFEQLPRAAVMPLFVAYGQTFQFSDRIYAAVEV